MKDNEIKQDRLFEGILWVRRNGKVVSVLDCLSKGNRHQILSDVRGKYIQYEIDYDKYKDEQPSSIRARVRARMKDCGFTCRKSVAAKRVAIKGHRGSIAGYTMRVKVRLFIDRQTTFL